MAEVKRVDFVESGAILEEEDEATLAAIDRALKSAEEGRVIPLDEVRRRMHTWFTRSSSRKPR